MSQISGLIDFLDPVNLIEISHDADFKDGQLGKFVKVFDDEFPDLDDVDIIIIGCAELRGEAPSRGRENAANAVRAELYQLYYWHSEIRIADLGNVKEGAQLTDSYAALKTVLRELAALNKSVLIIGGSHDLMLGQYYAFVDSKQIIEAVNIDALIDLNIQSNFRAENFLMEMLTGEPNFVRHYSHIGFQSYLVHPRMLETMDKLRFDCFRVGTVKENIEEMEPVIRNADILAFDISALAHAFAPATTVSPNGFSGEEACALMRYAGYSHSLRNLGIYGYNPAKDNNGLTAKQVSHMIWYFIDGRSRGKKEAGLEDKDLFNEYHTAFAEVKTTFLQSKKTGRWWMQLPDAKFIACSYNDYLLASSNETPERWLRAQERS